MVNLLGPPHASVELPEHPILQSPSGALMEPPPITLLQKHSCEYSVPAIAYFLPLQ